MRSITEPVFNRLREKLYKIRRKRTSSDPVTLDAIRQRKLSLQGTVSFQIGPEEFRKKPALRKGLSLDSATTQTDGNTDTQQTRTELSSERDKVKVRKESEEETLNALPHLEEREGEDSK